MKRSGLAAVVAGCIGLFPVGLASAEPVSAPRGKFRLVYQAPPGCPDQKAFLTQVVRRVGPDWLASSADLPGTIAVTIREDAGRFVAHMTLVDAVGRGASRMVEGKTCQAAESAMALITAMAIESAPSDGVAQAPERVPEQPEPPPRPPSRLRGEAGLGGGVLWGIAPRPAWGGTLPMMGFRWAGIGFGTRMMTSYWDTGEVTVENVRVRFQLLSVRGELCPWELKFSESVTLPLCMTAGVGVLITRAGADSSRLVRALGDNIPWAAMGLGTRLRLSTGLLFGELGGELSIPTLAGRNYVIKRSYEADLLLHKTPAVTAGLVAIWGCQFP